MKNNCENKVKTRCFILAVALILIAVRFVINFMVWLIVSSGKIVVENAWLANVVAVTIGVSCTLIDLAFCFWFGRFCAKKNYKKNIDLKTVMRAPIIIFLVYLIIILLGVFFPIIDHSKINLLMMFQYKFPFGFFQNLTMILFYGGYLAFYPTYFYEFYGHLIEKSYSWYPYLENLWFVVPTIIVVLTYIAGYLLKNKKLKRGV